LRLAETPDDMKKLEDLEKTVDGLENYEFHDSENMSLVDTKGDDNEEK
jgi:hypothetical protein